MPPVPPTTSRLTVKRDGHAITRRIPRPTVMVDTREQLPYTFTNYPNWIAGTVPATLPTGDYSVQGLETKLALERKSLVDLVLTLTQRRDAFLRECERLAQFQWRAILIEASYEDLKSPYAESEIPSTAHPNAIVGSLDAIEARWAIPILYTSRRRALAEERAASWLSKHFTYWWLEQQGLGRVLQEGDL